VSTIMSGSRYLIVSGDTSKFFVKADMEDEDDADSLTNEPLKATLFAHPSMAQRLIDDRWRDIVAECKSGVIQPGQLNSWQLFWKDAQVVTFHFSVRKENSHGR